MLSAQYVGDRTIAVNPTEPVAPGPGEVQIEVAFTGICGTDLHVLHGDMEARVTTPHVLGHEMSGRIAACGPDAPGWAVGDPVTVMPLRWCGSCPVCRAGNSHICENLNFVGIDSAGAMQERWTVPSSLLVRLPTTLSLRSAALVEPVAVAVHDVNRAAVAAGEQVVVVGGGPIGMLIALVAVDRGADVLVLELDPFRRGVAEQLGLRTIDPARSDLAAAVDDWTNGARAAVTFEVSGSQGGTDTALDLLAVRGRAALVGMHAAPRQVDVQRVLWREQTILGARVYEKADFEAAVALVDSGRIPVDALISRVEPLSSARLAFDALESGGTTMKVLVECGAS